jgi:hypothetical protein
MGASLLASAIASMLRWSRLAACSIQGHKLRIAAFGRRANTTCAACTNSVRRYLLPRLEILPRDRAIFVGLTARRAGGVSKPSAIAVLRSARNHITRGPPVPGAITGSKARRQLDG